MARPLLWLLLVPWTLPSAPGEAQPSPRVLLLEAGAKDGPLVHRAVALVADRLDSLGVQGVLVPSAREAAYRIVVRPADTEDPAANLAIEWSRSFRGETERGSISGHADGLETLAAQLAIDLAERVGRKVPAPERELVSKRSVPFLVQARLGAGEAYLAAGDLRRAYSRLEQAAGEGAEIHPEAQTLALRAKIALARGQEARVLADRDLATSALERARVARSRDRHVEAIDAYRAYLRYEHRVARPRDWIGPIDPATFRVFSGEHQTLIETGGAESLLFDEGRGELRRQASQAPLVGYFEEEALTVQPGPSLVRLSAERKAPRYRLKLPSDTSLDPGGVLPIVRGYGVLTGGSKLAWVDLGLGSVSERFDGRALASGEDGLLVVRKAGSGVELCLFRPGRHQPSFEVELPQTPKSASLTRGRVLIEQGDGLYVYDAETGKRRAGPFPVGTGLRHIGSHGRHGAFASGDENVLLLDVLAGESLATVRGPGRAVAAVSHEHGVALVFESGDVMFFDRDGRLDDRGRVPGRPLAAQSVGTLRPSLMVVSTEGVFFLLPPNPDTPREVDVYVALSELLERAGKSESALRIATHGARLGVGRVAELEEKRVGLLSKLGDATHAKALAAARGRAKAARELTTPLPRFRWID